MKNHAGHRSGAPAFFVFPFLLPKNYSYLSLPHLKNSLEQYFFNHFIGGAVEKGGGAAPKLPWSNTMIYSDLTVLRSRNSMLPLGTKNLRGATSKNLGATTQKPCATAKKSRATN